MGERKNSMFLLTEKTCECENYLFADVLSLLYLFFIVSSVSFFINTVNYMLILKYVFLIISNILSDEDIEFCANCI